MSISIYKSKVFNSKDIVDISIHEKNLKVEPSSFKDCFYRLNDKRINIDELENKIEYHLLNDEIRNNNNNNYDNSVKKEYIVEKDQNDEKCNNKKTNVFDIKLNNDLNYNMHLTSNNLEEIKCLYFFFLINILRFKNNLDLNVIRSICTHINNISNNDKNNNQYMCIDKIKENCLYSLKLKDFFVSVLKQCGKNEYNLNDFNRSIHIVIEKSSVIFLNTYKIVSSCKYLTCCFANLLEIFNLNYDILFMNSFNNNINNSNIKSINNIVSNLKWMLHDSKIEKNSNLSKKFSSNILLYIYTQSKLTDECEYFMNLINQNFKNSIESFTHEYNEEMTSIDTYINILCNNMNQTFYIYIDNLLNMCKNIMPLYIEKLNEFLLSEEKIITHNVNFKKPPVDGIILKDMEKQEDEHKGDIKLNLVNIYEKNILDKIELMFKQISEQVQKNNLPNSDIICNQKENDNTPKNQYRYLNNSPVEMLKKLNCVFINVTHLITDIIMHLNILNDIRAYNKAISQHMKQKKVSSCVHNVGVGCNEFKNFLYSFLSSENNILLNKSYVNKDKKLVTSHFYDFLEKYFSPYKYEEELNEILLPKNINFNLKTAKGCKDFTGEDMQLRNIFFEYIKKKFLLHGAVEIDTPIFELKETLMNKYGEDSKLIFDLKDQGGESLSLRYDLTVPLYRFINTNNVSHLKRFHIGKVYRRDEPSMNRGRFREFYQCDFDIVGKFDTLRTDFHILYIFWDILYNLRNVLGNFKCKLNHRKILEYMLLSCNIHKDKVKTVSSSIDKLDKITFQQFRDELLNDKGIHIEAIDKIEQYISKTLSLSPFLVIEFLRNDLKESTLNEEYKLEIQNCINHLEQIFDLLKYFNMLNQFSFDLSLARGLDYYTGIIFEFVLLSETNVGSVAAGGRYDFLIRNKRREYLPSVGASIGIERIITIAEEFIRTKNLFCKTKDETTNKDNKNNHQNHVNVQIDENVQNKKKTNISNKEIKPKSSNNKNNSNNSNNNNSENSNKLNMKDNAVDVLVCNIKKDCFKEIVELCTKLWENDISTEFTYVKDQKIQKQLVYALEKQIPLVLIIGDEIEQGIVKLREITLDKDKSTGEKEININDCIQEIKKYFTHNCKWKQNITNILFEKKQ